MNLVSRLSRRRISHRANHLNCISFTYSLFSAFLLRFCQVFPTHLTCVRCEQVKWSFSINHCELAHAKQAPPRKKVRRTKRSKKQARKEAKTKTRLKLNRVAESMSYIARCAVDRLFIGVLLFLRLLHFTNGEHRTPNKIAVTGKCVRALACKCVHANGREQIMRFRVEPPTRSDGYEKRLQVDR